MRRRHTETRSLPPEESARRWDAYTLDALAQRHPVEWLADHWSFQAPLYSRVIAAVPSGGRVLEVGAGAGPHVLWLAARGYAAMGVEYRPKLVEAARGLAERLELDCRFEVGDAFDLSRYRDFDLALSFGLIEHWERHETVRALREQAAAARKVIAVIPTRYTRYTRQVTDERFYSLRELRDLFTDAGLHDVRAFGYGVVPSRSGRAADLALPRGALRLMQDRAGWLSAAYAAIGSSR